MNPLRRLLFVCFVCFVGTLPATFTGCATPPSARVAQVQTLKALGHSAEAAVTLSAQLYARGRITAADARMVMDFYDTKFQPAYALAVSAVRANLDTLASPELAGLAAELTALVARLAQPAP